MKLVEIVVEEHGLHFRMVLESNRVVLQSDGTRITDGVKESWNAGSDLDLCLSELGSDHKPMTSTA